MVELGIVLWLLIGWQFALAEVSDPTPVRQRHGFGQLLSPVIRRSVRMMSHSSHAEPARTRGHHRCGTAHWLPWNIAASAECPGRRSGGVLSELVIAGVLAMHVLGFQDGGAMGAISMASAGASSDGDLMAGFASAADGSTMVMPTASMASAKSTRARTSAAHPSDTVRPPKAVVMHVGSVMSDGSCCVLFVATAIGLILLARASTARVDTGPTRPSLPFTGATIWQRGGYGLAPPSNIALRSARVGGPRRLASRRGGVRSVPPPLSHRKSHPVTTRTLRTILLAAGAGVSVALLVGCGAPSTAHPAAAPASASAAAAPSTALHADGSAAAVPPPAGSHGQADITFAQEMTIHHRGAVTMADLAASRASSAEIRALAVQIKADQDQEINEMSGWLAAWVPSTDMNGMPNTTSHSANGMGAMTSGTPDVPSGMPGMMSDGQMKQLTAANGAAFDKLFLQLMIMHHEGALEMARTESAQGINPAALALAKSISASQNTQITQMKALLAAM